VSESTCKCNFKLLNYKLQLECNWITNYFVKPFNYKLQSNVINYVIELHVINYYPTLHCFIYLHLFMVIVSTDSLKTPQLKIKKKDLN